MSAEELLTKIYYDNLWIEIVLLALSLILMLSLVIYIIVKFNSITLNTKIGLTILALILVALSLFSGIWFIKELKDLNYVKNNDFIHIKGTVIGFAREFSTDDLSVGKSSPIVLIENSDEKITLFIQDSANRLEIGKTYEFIYLPNTKRAEIKKICDGM